MNKTVFGKFPVGVVSGTPPKAFDTSVIVSGQQTAAIFDVSTKHLWNCSLPGAPSSPGISDDYIYYVVENYTVYINRSAITTTPSGRPCAAAGGAVAVSVVPMLHQVSQRLTPINTGSLSD